MQTYLTIFEHPLFYVFVGLTVLFGLIQFFVGRDAGEEKSDRTLIPLPNRPALKAVFVFALILAPIWLALLGVVLWALVGIVITIPEFEASKDAELRWHVLSLIGLITALGGLLGTPVALVRLFMTERQTTATEEGLITDRINKAVEGLGAEKTVTRLGRDISFRTDDEIFREFEWFDELYELPNVTYDLNRTEWRSHSRTLPNLEVRVGAIYALERIAQDSLRDHIQIMEILCAYIRENAPATDLAPSDDLETRPTPRTDIQTAIRVIGRRSERGKALEAAERFRLDLRNCDLSGVDFSKKDFSAAMFHRCRIEAAIFRETKLYGTEMFGSLLNHSDFWRADMKGTRLDHAIINRPTPVPGGMVESFNFAEFYGLSLIGADISALDYIGDANEMNLTFGSSDTNLSDDLEDIRSSVDLSKLRTEVFRHERVRNLEALKAVETEFENTGFRNWVPYTGNDLATPHELQKFYRKLGLVGFPFHGTPEN